MPLSLSPLLPVEVVPGEEDQAQCNLHVADSLPTTPSAEIAFQDVLPAQHGHFCIPGAALPEGEFERFEGKGEDLGLREGNKAGEKSQ